MKLNNAQLLNYVERIKFSQEDKEKYQPQIDGLKETVRKYISEHTGCKVTKVLQSGSWKKGTILYPKEGIELDIDLVFFLEVVSASEREVRQLNSEIKEFLKSVYKNKEESDFWDSSKSSGVMFRGTGLCFDIVPVVPIDVKGYVWQPEKGSKGYFYTSIEGQLAFNSDLKDKNINYTSIVRLLKKWKRNKNLELSSFSIEIVQGWLDRNKGVISSIEDGVIRCFDWLGRYEFPQIYFENPGANTSINTDSAGAVYIADPTNKGNNTAEYLTVVKWNLVQAEARDAFDNLMYAREVSTSTETLELWKEVFGSSFNVTPL